MNNSTLKQENIESAKPAQMDASKIQIEFDNIEHHLNRLSEIIERLAIKLKPIISPSEKCKTLASEYPNNSPATTTLFKFNQDLILNIDTLSFMYDNLDI